MRQYLFVYGSLRSPSQAPAQIASVVNRFHRLGDAQVNGRLYDLGQYCGAVLDDSADSVIHGDLVELPSGDEVLETLDRYEEIDPASIDNSLFARRRATVRLADGSEKEAWIYVYNQPTGDAPVIECGDYRQYTVSTETR
jgi:gamma-glutamylcyclotransferase (GGCT)/AIG2-like uncharacterized protein YtfP